MSGTDVRKKGISRRAINRGLAGTLALTASPVLAADLNPTPAQVEGPFHPIDAQRDTDLDLTQVAGREVLAEGEHILVSGRVLDTDGTPIANALVDVWQANHHGRYAHPGDPNPAPLDDNFQGWGLVTTDADGRYGIRTVLPGPYPLSFLGAGEDAGWRCRHIHFKVSSEGLAPITTQMYFAGDPLIEQDLEIRKAPEALRHLLIAEGRTDARSGLASYQFDIVLAPLPEPEDNGEDAADDPGVEVIG